jgi:hypothetical protein
MERLVEPGERGLFRTLLRGLILGAIFAFAGDLVGFRSGWWSHPAWGFAALGAVALAALSVELLLTIHELRRREGRIARAGRALAIAGLLAMAASGSANWLLRLEGYTILKEREAVPLTSGKHLLRFEPGPLADASELDVVLQLTELELLPAGGGFWPEARLEVAPRSGAPSTLVLRQDRSATSGTLRFHLGAFGFAPRIVLLRDGETLFDQTVMFETRRLGAEAITFASDVPVGREGLVVNGEVRVTGMDERMKGHPQLRVRVQKDGVLLGEGELLPGHFAEIGGGYRVGLAGLTRWAEIIVSRRSYGVAIFAGVAMLTAGLALWSMAAWRRW